MHLILAGRARVLAGQDGGAGILRISGAGEFDRDFQTYTGTGIIHAFMADQDPLDPDEAPVVSVPITLQWRRVNVL